MGAAETPIDLSTYVAGDPWTHGDFATLAYRSPKIIETVSSGSSTTPSYFESRSIRGSKQFVTVGTSGGTVVLESSHDGGDTWEIVKTYSTASQEDLPYPNFVMLRLRVSAGSNIRLALSQGL